MQIRKKLVVAAAVFAVVALSWRLFSGTSARQAQQLAKDVALCLGCMAVSVPAQGVPKQEADRVSAAIQAFDHMSVTGRPDETPEERDERMAWWREARFGMFIHWGIYSMLGGEYKDRPVKGLAEWIMKNGKISVADYQRIARDFNPVRIGLIRAAPPTRPKKGGMPPGIPLNGEFRRLFVEHGRSAGARVAHPVWAARRTVVGHAQPHAG